MKPVMILVGLILVIALLSAGIAVVRAAQFSKPADIEAKGLPAIRKEMAIFYGLFMPIAVGVISYFVYRWMSTRWPETLQTSFLLLAVGLAVLLTIMAAVVFKMRAFTEFTLLHILYAGGFGWIMPMLLK